VHYIYVLYIYCLKDDMFVMKSAT